MAHTIAEKIIRDHSVADSISPDEIVTIEPDWIMANDLSMYRGMQRMKELGYSSVAVPDRAIVAIDHHVPSSNEDITDHTSTLTRWVDEQHIQHFFDAGDGILHNVTTEHGYALPGQLLVGSDSHSTTQGAFGALSTGIATTDLAKVLNSGELWLRVPHARKITVENALADGCSAKDLALEIMGELTASTAIYDSIEYHGPGVSDLAMHERQTLTNLAVELGAQNGIVPPDETTFDYLDGIAKAEYSAVYPDEDATYIEEHVIDADTIEPLVAEPATVDNIGTVKENEGTPVDQVFVGTCNNGRYEDIESFCRLLGNDQIAPSTRLIVVPGSKHALKKMNQHGLSNQILDAGGVVNAPGCGPCFGAHGGLLGQNETCVGTMNRNFPGRMGPTSSEIYISSPQTAAATALYGELTDPREVR